jgi:hypothetical protein
VYGLGLGKNLTHLRSLYSWQRVEGRVLLPWGSPYLQRKGAVWRGVEFVGK